MIIKSFEIKKNLKKNVNIYLFYGPNNGLIEDLINEDLKPIFSENLYNHEETEILSDPDNFKQKIFNKSFFETSKLIIINRVTDKLLNLIQEISEIKIDDLKIILKSGNLDKKSKLRNFFEKNENLIITPCYEDTLQSLLFVAQKILVKNKIKISTQNINYIVEKSKGNRINLKNDLEKIIQYSKPNVPIEFNHLLKLTTSSTDYAISELTDQCLAKNIKKTLKILNENNSSSEDNILILKSFLFKLKRLKKLKEELDGKRSVDQVIASYRPPIFWKDKEIVKKQLKIWSLKKINFLIKKINNLELQTKKDPQISDYLVNNLIIESLDVSNNLI